MATSTTATPTDTPIADHGGNGEPSTDQRNNEIEVETGLMA